MTRHETKRLSIVLPHAIDRRLREAASREGRSLSNLAARLITEALAKYEGDGEPQ